MKLVITLLGMKVSRRPCRGLYISDAKCSGGNDSRPSDRAVTQSVQKYFQQLSSLLTFQAVNPVNPSEGTSCSTEPADIAGAFLARVADAGEEVEVQREGRRKLPFLQALPPRPDQRPPLSP